MSVVKPKPRSKAFILIAPSFDEYAIVTCLIKLREAGLSVALIGSASGLITGSYGLTVRPDAQLDHALNESVANFVVVPGQLACAQALMADPRVHQLLRAVLARSGYVAVMPEARMPVETAGMSPIDHGKIVWVEGPAGLAEFMDRLTNMLVDE